MSGAGVFETRDGLRLAYRLDGRGPLLVCQPGGPGRASTYLRDLAGLTDHRTLVLLDSRGTGSSDRPDDPERLRAPYVAGDLDDLRVHLGLETMDLLGHSAGAIAAQLWAAGHPARVGRLALVTPSGRLQGERGEATTRRGMYGIWNDVTAAHAAGADTEMDAAAEAHFHPDGGYDTATIAAALREVTAPVLVVAGALDRVTGLAAARAVAAAFADSRYVELDGLGHFPWVEQPAAFLPPVLEFLAG
jgi:pimeloyl-ACP methyl ester carboxylesterase